MGNYHFTDPYPESGWIGVRSLFLDCDEYHSRAVGSKPRGHIFGIDESVRC